MLDLQFFQQSPEVIEKALRGRGGVDSATLKQVAELSKKRREWILKTETLKAERNSASQEIGKLKAQAKTDPSANELAEKKMAATRELGDQVKALDDQLKALETELTDLVMRIPNIPHESVPIGADASQNQEVRKWGVPRSFDFKPADHIVLGEKLGILDFERASKISGARFSLYFGAGAALERALIQFMLDLHTREHGYREVIPPFMVNRESMTGTGQLPKFEEDLFKTGTVDRELFLIPTSEVPLTNIYAGEILDQSQMPIYFTAYSPCFRSEAGSYGKDTRGLIRQHQFQKVEMVKFSEPEHSFDELEKMTANAEKVLQLLGLPFRTVCLCTGDMGFGATKTYDIEVWLPGQDAYREISSCSNCGDFQARRAGIRYRKTPKDKPIFVHTLNGSGLAVGRTFIAILENHQEKDGTIKIPEPLHRYLTGAPGFVKKGNELFLTGSGK